MQNDRETILCSTVCVCGFSTMFSVWIFNNVLCVGLQQCLWHFYNVHVTLNLFIYLSFFVGLLALEVKQESNPLRAKKTILML